MLQFSVFRHIRDTVMEDVIKGIIRTTQILPPDPVDYLVCFLCKNKTKNEQLLFWNIGKNFFFKNTSHSNIIAF